MLRRSGEKPLTLSGNVYSEDEASKKRCMDVLDGGRTVYFAALLRGSGPEQYFRYTRSDVTPKSAL